MLKDSVETFYTYNLTGLVADIKSAKESDFEIDLNVEAPKEKPANNSVEIADGLNAPSVSEETTRKLLQGKTNILTVREDD